jgi:hypothetical protein
MKDKAGESLGIEGSRNESTNSVTRFREIEVIVVVVVMVVVVMFVVNGN